MTPGVHCSVPYLIANYFRLVKGKRIDSPLCGGRFITRLARSFGLLTPRNLRGLRETEPATNTQYQFYWQSGFVTSVDDVGGVYLVAPLPGPGAAHAAQDEAEQEHQGPPQQPPEPHQQQYHQQFQYGQGPNPWDQPIQHLSDQLGGRLDLLEQHDRDHSTMLQQLTSSLTDYGKTLGSIFDNVQAYREEQTSYYQQTSSSLDRTNTNVENLTRIVQQQHSPYYPPYPHSQGDSSQGPYRGPPRAGPSQQVQQHFYQPPFYSYPYPPRQHSPPPRPPGEDL